MLSWRGRADSGSRRRRTTRARNAREKRVVDGDRRSARFFFLLRFFPSSKTLNPDPLDLALNLDLVQSPKTFQPSAFEGEDEEDDEDDDTGPSAPPPQPKKKAEAKTYTKGTKSSAPEDDEVLDDPRAEKLRRQRLVEEADLEMAKELFGTNTESSKASFSGKAPATAKEAEEYGRALAAMFLAPHAASPQFKTLAKAVLKASMQHLDAPACKEMEAAAAAVRAEKVKADAAAKAAAGLGKKNKKKLNVGRSGGAAGLDDYVYDDPLDDDVDFM